MRKSLPYLLAGLACLILAAPLSADAKTKRHATPRKPPAAAKPAPPAGPSSALVVPQPGLLPDMTLGDPKAPITVVEYASAACPHCADWNRENWAAFRDKYIATGKVRYVFRELLTNPAEYALAGFMIGRCAVAKSKTPNDSRLYFSVVDAYFDGQQGYAETRDLTPINKEVTRRTGLSPSAQLDCVTNEAQITAFYKTMNTHAEADKVHSTPTFFVNGKVTDGHEMADLDAAIAAAKP